MNDGKENAGSPPRKRITTLHLGLFKELHQLCWIDSNEALLWIERFQRLSLRRMTMKEATTTDAAMTGRDGAIDFAAKQNLLHPAAHLEDHIYRVIEIVGTSEKSVEEAIQSAVSRASQTIRHLRWFEVVRTSGHINEGKIGHFQVTLKVGFTME